MSLNWNQTDQELDEIIRIAASLKGSVGGVKTHIDALIHQRELEAKRVHDDIESLQHKLEQTSIYDKEEREKIQRQIAAREEEQAAKVREMDARIKANTDENERIEREREAARGDADAEKRRLTSLLADLEEDASTYNRLRPAKSNLSAEDVAIIRKLFLSSAVSAGGKLSFADLKQIMVKYSNTLPEGSLRKLFELVENDTKGRMSYVTMVAVANDLAVLVADFRKIDANSSNTLSRKEFRDHFSRLGFEKKSVIDALFRYADEDESDEVAFNEYVHLALCMLVLRILYTFADYDKSGQLSKEEVRRVLAEAAVNESALKKFDQYFTIVDVDNSGTLNYPEFVMLVLYMFCDDPAITTYSSKYEAAPAPAAAPAFQVGRPYFIQSVLTDRVIDVAGGQGKGGMTILWSKKQPHEDSRNQQWTFTPEGFIQPGHANAVLDIQGAGGAGSRLCLWDRKPGNQNANQLFRYNEKNQTIVNPKTNLVLDVAAGNMENGAHLIVWNAKPDNDNKNQRWKLIPA